MGSSGLKIVVVLVVLLFVAIGVSQFLGGDAAEGERVGPARPGPGAIILEVGTEPVSVYRDESLLDGPEVWLPPRGWGGEVKQVRRAGRATRVSLDHHDIRIPGFLHLVVEIPGHTEQIRPGDHLIVTGRIADIRISRDPLTIPNRVHIDNATVVEHAKR
jgi:hypothetical protein